MGKLNDLTGQTFGRLTVLERGPDREFPSRKKQVTWYCKCSCGNENPILVTSGHLRSGHTKSCGCLRDEYLYTERAEDISGQKFGRLTAIRRGPDAIYANGKHVTRWICTCECGKEDFLATKASLMMGKVHSCGCVNDGQMNNEYEFVDGVCIGYCNDGTAFCFDADDYDKVSKYYWRVSQFGYIIANARLGDSRTIRLHRLIMDANQNEVVDHINHDKLDNRKCNLRVVSPAENQWNAGLQKNNASGKAGVYWEPEREKWRARITVNWKRVELGRFDSFDDAVAARKAAEEKYFGQYSYDNSMAAVPRIAV